ncbi:SUKH-3 domain-containing protein [Brenneria sp. 4F2]|nr:SUKH-3 domain-containing protein [Brenneria bubanii]
MLKIIDQASKYGEIKKQDIDLSKCLSVINSFGYSTSDKLIDFLKKYNGLHGYHSAYKNNSGKSKFFYINPEKAMLQLYQEQVADYEKITQCSLVPIGECDNGYIILMYGDDVIYGVFDQSVYKYGQNIPSCFDTLINGKETINMSS